MAHRPRVCGAIRVPARGMGAQGGTMGAPPLNNATCYQSGPTVWQREELVATAGRDVEDFSESPLYMPP
jgi:hypothetical protein